MKFIYLFILVNFTFLFSQGYIGKVYNSQKAINIREGQSDSTRIIGKIKLDEKFIFYTNKKNNWWKIDSNNGVNVYLNKHYIKSNGQKGVLINKKIYTDSKYYLIIKKHRFKAFDINIILVRPINTKLFLEEFYCKSLITICKGDSTMHNVYYDNMDPVGSCAGIYLPKNQPLENFFIFSKFGDYEGEIFILSSSGKLVKSDGGYFFITKDKKYIVSDWFSDLQGLSIFDLKQEKIIFSKEINLMLGKWYNIDNDYYVLAREHYDGDDYLYMFNFDKMKFIKTDKKLNKNFKIVKMYIDLSSLKDCFCN